MITPAPLTLTINKGSTFESFKFIAYQDVARTMPVDLTGYTILMKCREKANGPIIFSFTATVTNGPAGEITVADIPDEITDGPTIPRGSYVWDLLLQQPGGRIIGPFIQGPVEILLAVSRA